MAITGRIRQSFPVGRSAAWVGPFLAAIDMMDRGATFELYNRNGGFARALAERVDPAATTLVLDDTGAYLDHHIERGAHTSSCPEDVTFVVGCPRGYHPNDLVTRVLGPYFESVQFKADNRLTRRVNSPTSSLILEGLFPRAAPLTYRQIYRCDTGRNTRHL